MDITNPAHPLNPLNPLTDPVGIYGTHDSTTCVPTNANNHCMMSEGEAIIASGFSILVIIFCIWLVVSTLK